MEEPESLSLIEVLGRNPPHTAGHAVLRHGVIRAAHLIHQPAGKRAGNKGRGQMFAAAGEVVGGGAEAGGYQGHVLAPVHVGVLLLADGIIAGRSGEEEILRPVIAVLQCAGLDGAQGADHAGQQKSFQFQGLFISYYNIFAVKGTAASRVLFHIVVKALE